MGGQITYSPDQIIIPGQVPAAIPAAFFRATDYGVTPDGRSSAADATIASGSNALSSPSIAFTLADIGKIGVITDPANAHATGFTIRSVVNVVAFISVTAANAISNGYAVIGSDNKTALNAAVTAAANSFLVLPPGIMMTSGNVAVPDYTNVQGAGHAYGTVYTPAVAGSVIMAGGNFTDTSVVQLGTFAATTSGCFLLNVAVDAANIAAEAIHVSGYASTVSFCLAWRATTTGINGVKGTLSILDNVVGLTDQGTGILVSASDCMISRNIVKQYGGSNTGGIIVANGSYNRVVDNHIWQSTGTLSASIPGNDIILKWSGGGAGTGNVIRGNYLDGCYGHSIFMDLSTNDSSALWDTLIEGNNVLQIGGFPDATFNVFSANVAATCRIRGLKMLGNVGSHTGGTNSWSNIANLTGAGAASCTAIDVSHNEFHHCSAVVGFTPDLIPTNNSISTAANTAALLSTNAGRNTQTGNGATVAFNIPHGLAATPTRMTVTPRVALAAPNFVVTADATNVIVTYATAPPASANNVDNWWSANI